jgi:tetratricopeptide (TPR) repeat protein
MKRITLVCVALLVPFLAFAQPQSAAEWFTEGETQYNLGNFEKAADAFKQGFALETVEGKKAVYLYNVGQAYRQAKKCQDAIFFYKRFLALKANDTAKPLTDKQKTDTEKFIADLEECVKQQDAAKNRPPDGTIGGGSGSGSGSGSAEGSGSGSAKPKRVGEGGEGSGSDDGDHGVTKKTPYSEPKVLSVRLLGGASSFSAGSVKVPVEGTGTLLGGYPLHVAAKSELDLGAAVAFTPIAFTNSVTMTNKTATMASLLANVGFGYDVSSKLEVRGDLGLGILFFSGIDQVGSPFTKNGAGTSGTLGMFALRVGPSVDYAFTQNVYLTVAPITFSFSPATTGLLFTSLVRLDFMAGLGYRM